MSQVNGLSMKLRIKKNQAVVIDQDSAEDVARAMIENGNQNEPFFTFNVDDVCQRIEHWKNLMPRVKIFYAMKANDYEWMLKIVTAMGGGFDCASPGEIEKALQMNIPPESIIFAVPNKNPEAMLYARATGVRHTTFDTNYELKKLKQYWSDARLLIRIKIQSVAKYKLGEKFGCDPETEAFELLDAAATMGLKVVGVAFHVGSVCTSLESYVHAIRHAHTLFQYEQSNGRRMNILDIGGGFLSDKKDRINVPAKLINQTLEELFPDPEIQIVAEPGRYLCDSAMTLYTNISNVKLISTPTKKITQYYINEGVYGTLRCKEPWHTVKKFKRSSVEEEPHLEEAMLYGPTCDSTDVVFDDVQVRLPRCTPYDWLVFETQGAYTLTFTSVFSSLSLPQIRVVVSKSCWQKLKKLPGMDSKYFIKHTDISEPLPPSFMAPYIQNVTCTHTHTARLLI